MGTMRRNKIKNFKKFSLQFKYDKLNRLRKSDQDKFIDYASQLEANDKMDTDNFWGVATSKGTSDAELNKTRKINEIFAINAKPHSIRRNQLASYYAKKKIVKWQGIISDVKYKSKNNIWILVDHALELDGLYDQYNQNAIKNYIIDYHVWLDVTKIIDMPTDVQEIAIGDFIRCESAVSKYGTAKHVKYSIGATKIKDCGVISTSNAALNELDEGMEVIGGFVDSSYKRDEPILTLTKKSNFNIASQRFKSLYSANNNRIMLYIADYNDANHETYLTRLLDPNAKQKRKQIIKDRIKKEIKVVINQDEDMDERIKQMYLDKLSPNAKRAVPKRMEVVTDNAKFYIETTLQYTRKKF